jgi:hypothetical protein
VPRSRGRFLLLAQRLTHALKCQNATHGQFIFHKATRHNFWAGGPELLGAKEQGPFPAPCSATRSCAKMPEGRRTAHLSIIKLPGIIYTEACSSASPSTSREVSNFSFHAMGEEPRCAPSHYQPEKSDSPLLKELKVIRSNCVVEYRFWQPGGGHDLNIWNMKTAIENAAYCHNNPVKRG